jgi:putative FmdB family regulatory protein
MPIFEYRCQDCGRKFSALVGMTALSDDGACTNCGSANTVRLVSRFSRGRTEDQRLDSIADQLESVGDPDSPAEMRRMAREFGKALDEDASDEMEALMEEDLETPDSTDD